MATGAVALRTGILDVGLARIILIDSKQMIRIRRQFERNLTTVTNSNEPCSTREIRIVRQCGIHIKAAIFPSGVHRLADVRSSDDPEFLRKCVHVFDVSDTRFICVTNHDMNICKNLAHGVIACDLPRISIRANRLFTADPAGILRPIHRNRVAGIQSNRMVEFSSDFLRIVCVYDV